MLRPKVPPTLPEPQLRLTKLGLTTVPTNLSDTDLVEPHFLCSTCRVIFAKSRAIFQLSIEPRYGQRDPLLSAQRPNNAERFSWVTPKDLRSAHITRCHFCLIALQRLYEESKYYSKTLWSNFHGRSPDIPLTLELSRCADQFVARTLGHPEVAYAMGFVIATFSLASDTRNEPTAEFSDAQLVISTESNTTQMLIEHWMTSCANHGICGSYSSCSDNDNPKQMPQRLLGIHRSQQHFIVKLWEPATETYDSVSYVTLSHCWGKSDHGFLRLTRANMSELIAGISIDDLPRCFSDAVVMTWRLGERQIWIDSLCIIQDDRDDWHAEALRMAIIYENAAFTIAALGSGPHQSLFTRRDPLPFRPCRVTDIKKPEVFAHRMAKTTIRYRTHLDDTPLNRRAWVVQERLLSPRVLYLGGSEVVFECRRAVFSESWPEGHAPDHSLKPAFAAHNNVGRSCSTKCQKRFNIVWHDIVKLYTGSRLTFETDRHIALGGIIASVEKRTGLNSLIGMWKESIVQDLLWSTRDPSAGSHTNIPNIPSWTWLSIIDVTIDYHSVDISFIYGAASFLAQPSVDTHPGKAIGGESDLDSTIYLRVNAPLMSMNELAGRFGSRDWFRLDVPSQGRNILDFFLLIIAKITYDPAANARDCPVVYDKEPSMNAKSELGLILSPNEAYEGAYKRVGMFHNTYSPGLHTFGFEIFGGNYKYQEDATVDIY